MKKLKVVATTTHIYEKPFTLPDYLDRHDQDAVNDYLAGVAGRLDIDEFTIAHGKDEWTLISVDLLDE